MCTDEDAAGGCGEDVSYAFGDYCHCGWVSIEGFRTDVFV